MVIDKVHGRLFDNNEKILLRLLFYHEAKLSKRHIGRCSVNFKIDLGHDQLAGNQKIN